MELVLFAGISVLLTVALSINTYMGLQHARGESTRVAAMATEAMELIKAESLERKVEQDARRDEHKVYLAAQLDAIDATKNKPTSPEELLDFDPEHPVQLYEGENGKFYERGQLENLDGTPFDMDSM